MPNIADCFPRRGQNCSHISICSSFVFNGIFQPFLDMSRCGHLNMKNCTVAHWLTIALTTVFSELWWGNVCYIREMMTQKTEALLLLPAIFEQQREINSKVKWRGIQCTKHFARSCRYSGNVRFLFGQWYSMRRKMAFCKLTKIQCYS